MTTAPPKRLFLCNGAPLPASHPPGTPALILNYLPDDPNSLMTLKLPKFVDQLYHLPNRILDLLELAGYVFTADRATHRGAKDAVEYHAWSRAMHFVVKVRDADFWQQPHVQKKLSAAIRFMTGDFEYSFEFLGGHTTPPTSLFDKEEFAIAPPGPASVALFSGGLDSLAGVLERLDSTGDDLYLISHRSGLPTTKTTQNGLVRALSSAYPGRIHHYSFDCGLKNDRAAEETQRTRAFLFNSIAFAVAHRIGLDSFHAYENGVTSLNFLRRQDLTSARASRTTHPQTHALMADFLSELHGSSVTIVNPFATKTKTDVFALMNTATAKNLITSSVSCSKTFQRLPGNATHCGCCFQCIDRRLAAYAAGLNDVDDSGIYSYDIFKNRIDSPEARTTALDYVRQASDFSRSNVDAFALDRLAELTDVTQYVAPDEDAAVSAVWSLCHRHGDQVMYALSEVRRRFDDLRFPLAEGSLLQLIAARAHLADPASPAEDATATKLDAIHSDVRDLKQGVATVQQHVRGVPILQSDLAEARRVPEAVALEIENRLADILTIQQREIWRAIRNADGSQKDALPTLRKAGIVNSAPTLSRRVGEIDAVLKKNGLQPCDASGPAVRYTKTGGFENADGKETPEELSAVESDWAADPVDRDSTIRAYLNARPDEKAYFHQMNPGIEDEAQEYLKRNRMKSD